MPQDISSVKNLFSVPPQVQREYSNIQGNWVHHTAIVYWDHVSIGTNNIVGPYAVIGSEAQHHYYHSAGKITIGNDNTFRERCVVSLPTELSFQTSIGNSNYFMNSVTIHHDCCIEDDAVFCSNSAVAGSVHIMRGANLGMNSSVHQFQVIGSFSILGMNSCVSKTCNIKPGFKYAGTPARLLSQNKISLERNNISEADLMRENSRFLALRKEK